MKTLNLSQFFGIIILLTNFICLRLSSQTVTGSGTINYIPKWTATSVVGNSQIIDNGTSIAIGGSPNNNYKISSLPATLTLTNGQTSSYYGSSFAYNLLSNLVATSQLYGSRIITSTTQEQRASGVEGYLIPYLARNQNSSSNVYAGGALNTVEFTSAGIVPSGSITTGGYYLGGSISILRGTSQAFFPTKGTYSAVIGLDQIGTESSFAGYFEGKGYFSNNLKISTLQKPNNLINDARVYALTKDLNSASHAGFFEVDVRTSGATGGNNVTGVTGWCWGNLTSNIGVQGFAQGRCDNNSIAVGTIGQAQDAKTNYGIFGSTPNEFCLGTTNYAGYFSGNLAYTGSLSNLSDKRFKKDISPLENNMDLILQLNPVSYKYISDEASKSLSLPNGTHYGFISQEVEEIIPELVELSYSPIIKENKISNEFIEYKGLKYIEIIPILVGAIKELNSKVEYLSKIKSEDVIYELKQSDNELLDDKILLKANPNPGKLSSIIQYSINNSNASEVSISVYSSEQRLISEYKNLPNNGEVEINLQNLSSGIVFIHLKKNNVSQKIIRLIKN